MPRWVNILVQIVALVMQYANQVSGLVPARYRDAVLLGLALAQGIVAIVAHAYTPDGTRIQKLHIVRPKQEVRGETN